MQHKLLKGFVLLSSVASSFFLISAENPFTLITGSDVKSIIVTNSSRSNIDERNQLQGVLFGSAQASTAAITETSLGLILKGTIPSTNKEKSLAIIQLAGREERVIGIGEELIDRVILLEVLSHYVIILREGKREKISFPVVNRESLMASKSTKV